MAHDGCVVGWTWSVIHVPLEVHYMPHFMIWSWHAFLWNQVSIQEIILSAVGSKGQSSVLFFQSESRWHASGQTLSLTMSHLVLLQSLDFGASSQWSSCRNCFQQDWLLTMTLWPCSLLFVAQDIILVGSHRFLNHASTFADGCCLYIIHNGMSQWDSGVGSMPQCGRSEPESFKAIDAYIYG